MYQRGEPSNGMIVKPEIKTYNLYPVRAFVSKDHILFADENNSEFAISDKLTNSVPVSLLDGVGEEFIDLFTVMSDELGTPIETIANSERETEKYLRKKQ